MSKEFDKEVAAKIAEKDRLPVSMDKAWGVVDYENITYATFPSIDREVFWTFSSPLRKPEEMSKIEFYRQKVSQYEAVENLIESIQCELDDVARWLNKDKSFDEATLREGYFNMKSAYQSCLTCLKDLLKRL
jgi:hypothetical protein